MRKSGIRQLSASLAILTSVLVISHNSAVAESDSSSAVGVVELFTSHGCYSCPPADDALAAMLVNNDNFVALEFHVDYWNDLIWGSDGSWEDPFSKPEYTLRQQQYSQQALSGRTGVYTPQGVVNGRYAMVGVSENTAERVFDTAPIKDVLISVKGETDGLHVSVNNPSLLKDATIYLARYLKKTSTDITGGENNGKQLHNINVVTAFEALDELSGETLQQYTVAAHSEDNMGCAVLVQAPGPGPILGAATCP